jgi:phosphomecalonate degydratase small subunit
MNVLECKCIVKGFADGEPLISDTPINFLTMIDVENGKIRDPKHILYGKTLKSKIFVFPYSVGSSVGAYTLYSLKKKSSGPLAIICSNRMDITTASGCAISNIPAVHLKHKIIPQVMRNSRALTVDGERERILIYPN